MITLPRLMLMVSLLAISCVSHGKEDECVGLVAITRNPPKSIPKSLLEAVTKIFGSATYKGPEQKDEMCDSISTVINALSSGTQNGGKGSEGKKPLDPQQAGSALTLALEDPEINGMLKMQGEQLSLIGYESEGKAAQLIYAAALLNFHEKYLARDLLIQQLQKQVR